MEQKLSERRMQARQQVAMGRLLLLGIFGLTLVNQLLLVLGVEYHFWISAAVPYYLNWLCAGMKAGLVWRVLAGLVTAVICAAYLACWALSSRRRIWLTAGMGLVALDTLLLIIFAFTLVGNPASCVLEILVHLGCAAVLLMADQAAGRLSRMRRPRRMAVRPEREVSYE